MANLLLDKHRIVSGLEEMSDVGVAQAVHLQLCRSPASSRTAVKVRLKLRMPVAQPVPDGHNEAERSAVANCSRPCGESQ